MNKLLQTHLKNVNLIKNRIEKNIEQCDFLQTVLNYKAFNMHLNWAIQEASESKEDWKRIIKVQNEMQKKLEKIPLKCKCKKIKA